MIVRHIPMKAIKKSNFAGLIQYMTNEQGKQERVGEIRNINCQSQDVVWATHEIEATQHQNQRALGDKTYHLLISFPNGEMPLPEVLKDIEDRVCASIGYAEHQRVSVIHYDTDNFHIHVGINKIHPIHYTLHEPFLAYKKLAEIAIKLELEHGLQQTNHIPRKIGSENRADDMEHHAGVESLLGWIKRECMTQIQNAQSWAELHQVMQENGLELHERGQGLVITDGAELGVKASSVSRDFSKAKLEQRYGVFESQTRSHTAAKQQTSKRPGVAKIGQKPPPRSQHRLHRLGQIEEMRMDNGNVYSSQPIITKFNTVELYAKYQAEQNNAGASRSADLAQARTQKNKLIESAMRTGRLKRAAIKLLQGAGVNKKVLYALTSKTLKSDIEKTNKQYLKDREIIYEKYQQRAWADWLKQKATEGEQDALTALRSREARQILKGNIITGNKKSNSNPVADIPHDNITKTGTIIYRVGACAIRDDGDFFKISRGSSKDGLEAALHMAIQRYGECITVNGSEQFKDQIATIAASLKLNITFDDVALERRRQTLIQTLMTEKTHEPARQSDAKRRRANRGSNESTGTVRTIGVTRVRDGTLDGARINKPNIGRIGHQPPPESKNRLRSLSKLNVVQLASRGEVLLPGNVSGYVEHQRTESDNQLRRDVSGSGSISQVSAAADKYIAERELTRQKISNILQHRRYHPNDEGSTQYVGMRQVDGEMLVLLKYEEQIVVLQIDTATARRVKRLSVGEVVTITSKGIVAPKGRSR